MDTWDLFALVGTVSFSLQGGLIAIEKRYDLFAVYLFGMLTAFGGGALRNVLIGGSDYELWNQEMLFTVAVISITAVIVRPGMFFEKRVFWGDFLDSIGIIAFAVQGSLDAVELGLPASAVVVSALITATGGGIIRDLLSQRRPIVLGEVVYGLWIFLVGLIIGMGWATADIHLYVLFGVFTTLRVMSFHYDWKIPYRKYQNN